MRRKMFRLLSVLLASTMVVSSAGMAFADEELIDAASYVQEELQTPDDNADDAYNTENIAEDTDISNDQTEDDNVSGDQTSDAGISDDAEAENEELENNETADKKEDTAASAKDDKEDTEKSQEPSKEESAESEIKSESNTAPEDEITLASDSAPDEDPVKPTASITDFSVVRNNGGSYGMFPVSNASYEVQGDKITISFITPKKKVFTGLYLGYCTDENKEPVYYGTVNGKNTEFTIEVPLSAANSWIPIAIWRPDKVDGSGNVITAAHWKTDEYLWMSIPNVTNIKTQPSDVCAKSGDTAELSVAADGEELTYKWQYSIDNETWSDCEGENAGKAEYSFEMAESAAGYYRCIVSGSYGSVTSKSANVSLASDQDGYSYNSMITAVYSNNTVINKANKIGTEYSMFKVAESSLKVTGSSILVNVGVKPASSGNFTYSDIAVYTEQAASKDDLASKAESGQVVSGNIDTGKNLQFYSFTIPLSCAGSEVYFIPKSASKGTWSTSSEFAFKIPALSEFKAPSKIEITKQPQDMIAAPGAEASLSVEASGDEGLNLSCKWQYSTDETSWSDCEGDSAKEAVYSFTMSEELAGKYRCIISDETGTEVTSDTASVSVPKAPVVTGDKVRVVKDNGDDFKMFTVDSSEVTEDKDSLEVTFTTKNYSFDKIYFGYKDVADKADESELIKGTQTEDGGYKFTFTVPASYKGQVLPIALNKQSGGSWYTGAYLWIYIPDEGISETVDTDISAVYGGTGADVKSVFSIQSSKAVLKSDSIVLTINVSGNTYNKLYIGTQEEAKGNDSTCVGSYDADKDITSYTFEIPRSKQGMYIAITPGNSSWYSNARDIFIKIPNFDNVSATSENGIYDLYGSAYPTNNIIALCFERESSLKIENGKATVTLVTQASNYDKIYIGDVSDSDSIKEENAVSFTDRKDIGDAYRSAVFEISLSDLGKDIKYVVRNAKTGAWNTKQSLFKINDILNKTGDIITPTAEPTVTPTETPTVTPTDEPTVTPTQTPSNVPADGIYSTTAETGAAMFKVVDVELTVKNGKMTAKITMSGTGNTLLYMGSASDAPNNGKDWIYPCGTVNLSTGKEGYQFEIPVSALDTKISLASKGRSDWYDRTITFSSADLKKTGDIDPDNPTATPIPTAKPTAAPTATPTTAPDKNPDKESTYTPDTNGSTSAVDNSTKLKDGVYTPDSFTYTGGTGKVTITCTKITITNGQAYATIVFSSAKYGYVKANGNTYYPTVSGNTSTFTIPVELNKNNKIIGMTTAMTNAHEIEYTIFVYLAAANNTTAGDSTSGLVSTSNKELDKTAPQIVGLTYKSETKLENAEYFKIYNYEDGIVLLEIDTTKDTANDPDKADEKTDDKSTKSDVSDSKSTKDKNDKKDEVILEDEIEQQESSGQVTSEDTAKLYKENVVKYLIVPEDADIPVGLDKDMIVIRRQENEDFSAFVSSMEALGFMNELDSLDVVSALGLTKAEVSKDKELSGKLNIKETETTKTSAKKSKTTSKSKTAAKSTAADKTSEDVVYTAGSQNEPDYKQIVRSKVDLTILGSDILPKENEDDKASDKSANASDSSKKDSSSDDIITADEQNEIYNDVTEKMATLGIPAIIDRSSDEKSEIAKYEWIKVYGAIFGKSDEAQKLYDEKAKAIEEKGAADEKNTK